MDPQTLSRVLNLNPNRDPIITRRARVRGYKIKLWGSYPALIVDEAVNQHPVYGKMCEILSQTHMDRLAAYETDKYRLGYCVIEILNDDDDDSVEKSVNGVLFMWNGAEDELRPGTFDLRQWKKEKELRDLDRRLD